MPPPASTSPWAGRLALSLTPALDGVRLVPGLEGMMAGEWLWVKGVHTSEAHAALLAQVPWFNRYEIIEGNWLLEHGHALPSGRLPETKWTPLPQLLTPLAPAAALPGDLRTRTVLELQRSSREQPAALMMLPLEAWHDYAVNAPGVRLARLNYVQEQDLGRILVRGNPLPPLPGRLYYLIGPAAIPCGFEPVPPLQPATLRGWLGLAEGDVVVFDEDGTFARVPKDEWRPADRSVIRANGRTAVAS